MNLTAHQLVPEYSRHLLQIGDLIPTTQRGYLQKSWQSDEVGWMTQKPSSQSAKRSIDCVVIAEQQLNLALLQEQLADFAANLNPNGQISVLFSREILGSTLFEDLDRILKRTSLLRYHSGPLCNEIGGGLLAAIVLVRADYDPIRHAREKMLSGRMDQAVEILNNIPINLIPSNEALAQLTLEKQRYYLNWQKASIEREQRHMLFSSERKQFAQVTALKPHWHLTYHLHAELWNHLGRDDMAVRLLRSLQSVVPSSETQLLLNYYESRPLPALRTTNDDLPFWQSAGRTPRILVLTHDFSDYGMDTLYHGLCTLLGNDHVVEFPWKPTLHNQQVSTANNYPCVFDFPGEPHSAECLAQELEAGRFDLILYADVVQMAYKIEISKIMKAATHLPVVLYDTWDDCYTPMDTILGYIGRESFDVVFKRELVDGVAYACDPYPLPFGYPYPQALASQLQPNDHSEPIFWAGKKDYGLRPLYIEWLEKRFGRSLERSYSQEEYRQALCGSRIGLSFFGCGFDTVRYWEVPANRVMLLSERLPIRVPYDFEDGISAVFFGDLREMESKLDYYLDHPDECERIAAAGYAHYTKYHTTTARAQQFLGVVSKILKWD
jgi:Glycosyl transferases group 1